MDLLIDVCIYTIARLYSAAPLVAHSGDAYFYDTSHGVAAEVGII